MSQEIQATGHTQETLTLLSPNNHGLPVFPHRLRVCEPTDSPPGSKELRQGVAFIRHIGLFFVGSMYYVLRVDELTTFANGAYWRRLRQISEPGLSAWD